MYQVWGRPRTCPAVPNSDPRQADLADELGFSLRLGNRGLPRPASFCSTLGIEKASLHGPRSQSLAGKRPVRASRSPFPEWNRVFRKADFPCFSRAVRRRGELCGGSGSLRHRVRHQVGCQVHLLEQRVDGVLHGLFSEFLTGSFEDDIFFKLMTVKSHSYAFRDSDHIPDRVFLSSRLYNEIYIPQGIRWPLRIELIHGGKLIGQFALFNKEETGDFN